MFLELLECLRGRKLSDDEDIIRTANGWLKEQEELFLYSGLCALEKCRIKCISIAGDSVKS